jgi:hypothetical protein
MKRDADDNILKQIPITPSGRLADEIRHHTIHNLPEGGDDGAENEYSSNWPDAWKRPKPIDTEKQQEDYWKWKARHMDVFKEKSNPGYRF